MAQVLVVDDEPKLGKLVAEMLELDGHQVRLAGGGREALDLLSAAPFDIVLTDLKMPDLDGMSVLVAARKLAPPPEVVMMTAYGTAASAVAAMKAGAADYLIKPFAMDELRLRVQRLSRQRVTESANTELLRQLAPDLVAESAAMKAILVAARRVAATDSTVLLLGESGTGKSQLARYIHFQSRRATAPLNEVHCAALPETLMESELFGHERGAFTGATVRADGQFAAADRGTLFLDEIGEITPSTQVKLLRFLQEREFTPVGSSRPRKVDVRIIAATNRDLEAAVKAGQFRQDFYYRLNVFSIVVPPLRERPADIRPLAERFLAREGQLPSKLSEEAWARLTAHPWPGNIRELENALERALVLSGTEVVEPSQFTQRAQAAASGGDSPGALLTEGFNLDDFEKRLIQAALDKAGGNKTQAAKLLGITRRRMYSRLESFE